MGSPPKAGSRTLPHRWREGAALQCGKIDRQMAETGHERPKGDFGVESALLPTADIRQRGPHVPFVPILLQKSFCTGDQKFRGLQARLSCKDARDLIASRQTHRRFGNAIEVIRIGDCFPFRVFAKKS
jgi:hypothetical protein